MLTRRVSDAQLVILLPRKPATAGTGSVSSARPSAAPSAKPKTSGAGRKRKPDSSQPCDAEDSNWEHVLSIPVHRVVLMAKCVYFSTLLRTALGSSSTTTITEHACSGEEVQAIKAAAECVYTDKLPLLATVGEGAADGEDIAKCSQAQMHILTLVVGLRPSCR